MYSKKFFGFLKTRYSAVVITVALSFSYIITYAAKALDNFVVDSNHIQIMELFIIVSSQIML